MAGRLRASAAILTTNSITIDGNKTVTATFTQNEYTLTINKIGSGTVTADPAKTTYHYDDVVTLTATADTGWTFGGFSGDTTTDSITIDGNKTVTATFTQNEYSLSINTDWQWHGDGPDRQGPYHYGDIVTLTATADTGWTFGGFSGDTTTNTMTINGNKSVTATFTITQMLISGHITEPDGNTPAAGVTVDTNGITSVTDANGYYELSVPYGWSGMARPVKEGFGFEPNDVIYNNVTSGMISDYNAVPVTFVISGYITDADSNMPIADVNVHADANGGPFTSKYGQGSKNGIPYLGRFGSGSTVTDANGYYEVMVDYNWSGKIMPAKYSYVFEPNSRSYVNVIADQNEPPYTGTLTLTVVSSAGVNGSIDPCGVRVVDYGSSQMFTAAAAMGYQVEKWSVDGNDVQVGGTTYTLSSITASHTVTVTFIPIEYTLAVNTVGGGTVTVSLPGRITMVM